MNSLVQFVMRSLEKLDDEGSSEEFRQGISVIKDNVRDRMPRLILADLIYRFMQELVGALTSNRWCKSNYKASFELLMDVEIVGQSCDSMYFDYIDPQDMHRFRGIEQLDFSHLKDDSVVHRILENCHLQDLTRLILDADCTDNNLTLIGKNCSKLEDVRLPKSFITDEGLRALSPCQELRIVDITDCDRISHVGINHLMSVHEKLERLSFGNWIDNGYFYNSRDFLSRLEKPCSSIECLCIKTPVFTSSKLCSIIEMFPNLSHLTMNCERVYDLTILKYLGNLSGIRIGFTGNVEFFSIHSAWWSLQELLKLIGEDITTLEFSYSICSEQHLLDRQSLNFIYEYCPNIEHLKFDFIKQDLIVPPFQELKGLCLHAINSDDDAFEPIEIWLQVEQFQTMVNLESLDVDNFNVASETVKSIMLNNTKFPKLATLRTDCEMAADEVQEIKELARKNNLDFGIYFVNPRNCLSSWEN